MSRFLTPSQFGLLVLIDLYHSAAVPNQSIIPVLSFISSRLNPQPVSGVTQSITQSQPSLSLQDFENATKDIESSIPGRSLYDAFLSRLWGIDSLHDFFYFFEQLPVLLINHPRPLQNPQEQDDIRRRGKINLGRASPLGLFVRRAYLEFSRLQFDDCVKLWLAVLKLRAPAEAQWRKKCSSRTSDATHSLDTNLSELKESLDGDISQILYSSIHDGTPYEPQHSTAEMLRMLDFQLEKLQRFGNRLPDDVRDACQAMLKTPSQAPNLVHFVRFFDSWRTGDYTTAFDSLHRYFDYTMHTRDRSFYQYALLHMAILHADFGCFSEALAAMNETISTARENQDMSCLNFSLSWLNHLSKAYPSQMRQSGYVAGASEEREGLIFLKNKAKEMKLPNLLSSTLLAESKMILSMGESVYQAFERLYQATHLNVMCNIENSYGSQLLIQSSLFGRLGLSQMSDTCCEILLECYAHVTPIEENLRASCRRAYTAMQRGRYNDASKIFESLYPTVNRNLRAYQYLATYSSLMKLKHSLRRHDLDAASYLLEKLTPSEDSAVIDPELAYQIELQRIDYLQRLSSYDTALDAIETLAHKLRLQDADIYQRIHTMVLKALLFHRTGKPLKGFTVALRATQAAWHARILPALWEAWAAVANILGALAEFDAQKRILDAVLPQALESGDFALCAQLYVWQADACMGLAGREVENQRVMNTLVARAEEFIIRASFFYKAIEDIRGECDTLYKRSMIAKLRGDEPLAEEWATRYIDRFNSHMKSIAEDDDISESDSSIAGDL